MDPQEENKKVGGLEHLCCEEKVWEMRLVSVEMRRLQGALIAAFQYITGAYRIDREELFIRVFNDTPKATWTGP